MICSARSFFFLSCRQTTFVFVEKIWKNGTHDQINEVAGRAAGMLLYGYYFDFKEDGTKRYMMGTEIEEGFNVPPEYTVLYVPAQTYAVFDSREKMKEDVEIGLEIQNVWRRIYSEWFPSSIFEQVDGPCIEKYYWVDDRQVDSIIQNKNSPSLALMENDSEGACFGSSTFV